MAVISERKRKSKHQWWKEMKSCGEANRIEKAEDEAASRLSAAAKSPAAYVCWHGGMLKAIKHNIICIAKSSCMAYHILARKMNRLALCSLAHKLASAIYGVAKASIIWLSSCESGAFSSISFIGKSKMAAVGGVAERKSHRRHRC